MGKKNYKKSVGIVLPFYNEEYAAVGKFGTGCVYDRIKQKIIKLGGKINLKESVVGLKSNGNSVIEIKTTKKTYYISNGETIISTLPSINSSTI